MNIYKKIVAFFTIFITLYSPCVFSIENTHAKIELYLEVEESGCIVSPESEELIVDLGVWSTKEFKYIGSQSSKTHFKIGLEECQTDNVSIMFSGKASSFNKDYLAVDNENLSGIGIEFYDQDGTFLALNKLGPSIKLNDGSNILNYYANYISGEEKIQSGVANAIMTFGLYYD